MLCQLLFAALAGAPDFQAYVLAHRDQVSLATWDLNAPEQGIYLNADQPRPLASTYKLMVLYGYARAIATHQARADEPVALADVEAYYLPGTDGGAHQQWHGDPVPLSYVAHAMVRYSDNAATDYLQARFGAGDAPAALGLPADEKPIPGLGQYLLWADDEHPATPAARLATYQAAGRAGFREMATTSTERFAKDPAYRAHMRAYWARGADPALGYPEVAALARLWTAGTARSYAAAMGRVLTGQVEPPGTAPIMQELLEWPKQEFPANWNAFEAVGTKGGSLPGILTDAWFSRRKGGPTRVSALFLEGLPADVFQALGHSFAQQQWEASLLADDRAFERARQALRP